MPFVLLTLAIAALAGRPVPTPSPSSETTRHHAASAQECARGCGVACTAHTMCGDDIPCGPAPCYSCTVAPAPLQRPTRLRAALGLDGGMWLSWSDNSTGESGYRVYRATRNGRWDL